MHNRAQKEMKGKGSATITPKQIRYICEILSLVKISAVSVMVSCEANCAGCGVPSRHEKRVSLQGC